MELTEFYFIFSKPACLRYIRVSVINWVSVTHGHPVYNGHPYITDSFVCPDEKLDHMFSLKFTRLIGTPVDTDNTNNGHFCVSWGTDAASHRSSTSPFLWSSMGTAYLRTIYSPCHNPCALFFCLLFHRLAVRISLPFHTFYGHCTLPQERQIFNTVFLRVHVWPLYCNHLIGLFQKYHNTLCCIGFCLSFFLRLSASYYTSFTSLAFCWSYCPLPFEIDPTFFLFVCFSSNINTTLVRNVFSQSSNTYTMVCPLGVRI